MRDVILLGLNVHGLECADIIARTGYYRLIGYISQEPEYPEFYEGYPVLGIEEDIDKYPEAGIIPLKWESFRHLERWVSLIDPSAFISSTAEIGKGSVIYPGCFIGPNVVLGKGVYLLSGCTVNHDDIIGDKAVLTSRVTLAGHVTIGEYVYMGQGSNVRQNVKIGAHAFVGMGSVVLNDVPEGTTVIGNPARTYINSRGL
jgi:UDP-3-O-[3-hydroxymyristoyl] glucosamine N-acyltransferase